MVRASVSTPARDLELLALLVASALEARHSLPRACMRIKKKLETAGPPASEQIDASGTPGRVNWMR